MIAADEAIRSWLSMAFDRVVGLSGALRAVVSGGVGLPNIERMLDNDDVAPWEIADEAGRSIERLESVLRSRAMADVVTYGFGHRLLTETNFAALGDADKREVVATR